MSSGLGGQTRRRKIAGLVLIAIALVVLGYLSERPDWQPWADAVRSGQLARRGLLFVGAGNLLALGLLALLGASAGRPLASRAGAWKSLLMRMAGANLLIVLMGLLLLYGEGVFGDPDNTTFVVLVAFMAGGLMARAGVLLVRRGWKYHAVAAETLLQQDPRPPVVYIRSFADDDAILVGSWLRRTLASIFTYMAAISLEQELAMILGRVGPVVAIGKPGESLPELGASRLYATDDEWRDVITGLMRRAGLVVVRAGSTPNLQWEIDEAARLLPLRKLILVCFARGGDVKRFEADIARRFGAPPVRDPLPDRPLMRWFARFLSAASDRAGRVVYFDEESRPHAVVMRFALSWMGYFSLGTRPYHDLLNDAFRRVFPRLGLPWIGNRSRTVAALLALFGGAFGAHYFYLGDRRRALLYLLFFWTFVPFFLAWRDAARFALLDQREFERRFLASRGSA